MKNAEAAISSRRGGVKSLSNGEEGELKTFRTEGGVTFAGGGGVSTSLHVMKMKLENESKLLMLDMY